MNYFDKTTIRLLKQFYREPSINEFNISKKQNDSLDTLLQEDFIHCDNRPQGYDDPEPENGFIFKITLRGKAYIEMQRANTIKFWIPIIISNTIALVALIISIIALKK